MADYLRGNYELDKKIKPDASDDKESVEQEFYRRAHQRLGGSISYIMKSKNLLWKGDGKAQPGRPSTDTSKPDAKEHDGIARD